MTKRSLLERFWRYVPMGVTGDDCWEWLGSVRGSTGYGQLMQANWRPTGAHRVAWELWHGPIPAGQFVLHRCDNPRCVRPGHLFLGDHGANMEDAARKWRFGGEWSREITVSGGVGTWSAERVERAARLRSEGMSWRRIGLRLGVTGERVRQVLKRCFEESKT